MDNKNESTEASLSMVTCETCEDFEKMNVDVPGRAAKMGLQFGKPEDKKNIVDDDQAGGDAEDPHHLDDHDHDNHGPLTHRQKLKAILHSQRVQIAIICLVVLDCIFVVGELVLDYEKLLNANKNCPTAVPPTEPYKRNSTDHVTGESEHETEEPEHESESAVAKAAEALHILSLIILSIFIIELTLKMYALGTEFFHSKLEVFDAIVIVISFIFDVLVLILSENFEVLNLIVILRLWRIIRVVNGVILSVEQREKKKIIHFKRVKDRAVHAAMKFEQYSGALEDEIHVLRDLVERSGVKIDEEMFKNKPEKPHYDKNYHTVSEDGDNHHHHHLNPFHRHHKDKSSTDNLNALHDEHADSSQPPDYHTVHHGNEADC